MLFELCNTALVLEKARNIVHGEDPPSEQESGL